MEIKKVIVDKTSSNQVILVTQELLDNIQVGDELAVGWEDQCGVCDEGSNYFKFMVIRNVEETAKEKKKREEKTIAREKRSREMRYQSYLKYKIEFENE